MKNRWRLAIALLLLLVALPIIGGWILLRGRMGDFGYEIFTATVTRGPIRKTVVSTGKLDALVRVDVGSQVTGQVQELHASFNSIVREGQVIAQLDPRNFQAQVRNAEANLASARSRIETSRADRLNADASLASARANLGTVQRELAQAETNMRRSESLHADGFISETEMENVTIQLETARARLTQQEASVQQAEVQLVSRDAAITQAEAALEQAEADLEEARLNLGYATIRSPVNGVVISREIDVGQTVSASTSAPTLFVIANDLTRMQVQANIDEADIGLLGPNKRVDFTVDAFPDEEFVGRIEEIRLNSSTAQNVVTYGVIITFDNPDMKLKPGMTAYLTITVAAKDDVLTVPNAALRYEPPRSLIARSGAGSPVGTPIPMAAANPVDNGYDLVPSNVAGVADIEATRVLMPGQLWNTGEMLQFQAAPAGTPRAASVWVLHDGDAPQEREIVVGISDGSVTEVISGDLREDEIVIVSDSSTPTEEDAAAQRRGGFTMTTIR
jgi:HlyD family secretion protein